jgi:hypothetical protein
LGDVETIPLYDLVHNNVTYCARISRHFLVRLISEHVQELWQVGDKTFISTNIGRFTLYPHEGRSLVHFDGSIRTSTTAVIANQALEDIQRAANGEYKDESGTWHKVSIDFLAVVNPPISFFVYYLRTKDIEEWRFKNLFADVLAEIVQSVVQEANAPASFAAALAKNWLAENAIDRISNDIENLAWSMQTMNLMIKREINNLNIRGR